MKLTLEERSDHKEIEVIIRYGTKNQEVERLYHAIQACTITLQGMKDRCAYPLSIDQIIYIDSVDEHTYLYCKDAFYESHQKLYELEACLAHTSFVRIAKACIINTDYVLHVKPLFDGKFIATLSNGETLIINRQYVKNFKEVLGL